MHKFRLITILLFTFPLVVAAAPKDSGIRFFEGTWSALLETAKKENKLIFVDVYTTWCPPCKQMDKEVIPQPEVGRKYNALFLNYRLDAEKGEGIAIAQKYNVKAYPTYLYLNAQGDLLHRAVGFYEAPAFIAQAEKASQLANNKKAVGMLEKEFREGNRQPEFLRNYIEKLAGLGLDNTEAMNAYFAAIPASQLTAPAELMYMGEHMTSARANGLVFLMSNYNALNREQRQKLAPRLYKGVLYDAFGTGLKEGRPAELQQLIAYMDILKDDMPREQQPGISRLKMLYYGMVKDAEQLKKAGYSFVGNSMNIPLDSIRAEDARKYRQIMEPFLRGERDSTKVVGFQEEKQYLVNLYSREIGGRLYEAANAFAASLEAGDPALKDALLWAERAKSLTPDSQPVAELAKRLEKLVRPSS